MLRLYITKAMFKEYPWTVLLVYRKQHLIWKSSYSTWLSAVIAGVTVWSSTFWYRYYPEPRKETDE